jgi:LacI family transcriptional regulator
MLKLDKVKTKPRKLRQHKRGEFEEHATHRSATMMDVARVAAVSQSSVSLVLNGMTGARISDVTRQRVIEAARELGYSLPFNRKSGQPDVTGRDTLVYFVDEISPNPFPVQTLDGIRDAAWEAGFLVAGYVTRSDRQLETATTESILRNRALIGVIYSTIFTRHIELPHAFAGVPTVCLNCYTGDPATVSIIPGEVVGGHNATSYLIDRGHRRIAFINGETWMDAATQRLKGYRQALATADIPFDASLVRQGNWLPLSGYQLTHELLNSPKPPTAIFCSNDMMAIGALEAIHERGLSVPDDISVIGYDDHELARYTRPPLTTVVLPNYEMGRRAAEVLIDIAINGKQPAARLLKIDGPISERSTVKAIG